MRLLRVDGAAFSPCGRYRYLLTRRLGNQRRTATFILLNPSTADAERDDPTIRRCLGFARRWGCGRVFVLNLFALRATDPTELRRAADPVGPDNARWLAQVLRRARRGRIVCGWGIHGAHLSQDRTAMHLLAELRVRPLTFGMTKHGHPRHPLYLPYAAALTPLRLAASSVHC
jgi:hypothetical protein